MQLDGAVEFLFENLQIGLFLAEAGLRHFKGSRGAVHLLPYLVLIHLRDERSLLTQSPISA